MSPRTGHANSGNLAVPYGLYVVTVTPFVVTKSGVSMMAGTSVVTSSMTSWWPLELVTGVPTITSE